MAKISLRSYNREIDSLVDGGQIEEAIAHCRHILKAFPKHIDTYRLLGKAYLESQRYSDAADVLQRVLSASPEDFVAHVGMSIIREDEGHINEAIWHMERAFEIQPANSAIQDELRRLYGRRDGFEPPKVRLTRGALARMYVKGDLHQQAIGELRAALAEDPQRIDLQVLLARVYLDTGQRVDAADNCSAVLRKLPYCLEANHVMAEVLAKTERAAEAQAYRQRIQALDPYLAHTGPAAPTPDKVPDNAVTLERLIWTPGGPGSGRSSQPDWAASLGVEIGGLAQEKDSLPDWLSAAAQEAPPRPVTGQTISPFEDTFDAGKSEEIQAGSPTAPESESPDWLTGPTPAVEIPDWMKDAGWTPATGAAQESGELAEGPARSFAIEDEKSNGDLEQADIPGWLLELEPQSGMTGEAGTSASVEIPEWLSDLEPQAEPAGDETTPGGEFPGWLRGMADEIPATPPESSLPEPPHPAVQSENELPSWLQTESQESPEGDTQPVRVSPQPQPGEDMPAFLATAVDEADAGGIGSQAAGSDEEHEDIPDWLKSLQDEPSPETKPTRVPGWLDSLKDEPLPETIPTLVPDWIGEVKDKDATGDQGPVTTEEEAPEWLKELEPEDSHHPQQQAELVEAELAETEPVEAEHLEAGLVEASQKQQAELVEAEPVEAPPSETFVEAFEQETGEQFEDAEAAFAWLESLAVKQGANEALLLTPEERQETPPEWVVEAAQSEPSRPGVAGGAAVFEIPEVDEKGTAPGDRELAAGAEMPDWLQETIVSRPEPVSDLEPAPGEEVHEWLHELEPETTMQTEQPEAIEEAIDAQGQMAGGEVPDWLQETILSRPEQAGENAVTRDQRPVTDEEMPDASQQPQQQAEPVEAEPVEPSPQQAVPVEAELVEAGMEEIGDQSPAFGAEIPDWLQETLVSHPEQISEEGVIPSAEPAEEIPEWLKDLEPQASQQPHQQAEPVEAEPVEATPVTGEDVPDWLKELGPEPSQQPQQQAELVEAEPAQTILEAREQLPAQEEELPDWLKETPLIEGDTKPTRVAHAQSLPFYEGAISDQGPIPRKEEPEASHHDLQPAELVEAELVEAELVEAELVEAVPPEAELAEAVPVEATPVSGEEIPDWLKELEPESSQQQQAELVEAEPAEAELVEAESVELSPQQAEPVEAEPVETVVETGEQEAGGQFEDADAAFAWLESLAVKQGASEALLLTPEERQETPPDWVVDAAQSEPSGPEPVVQPEVVSGAAVFDAPLRPPFEEDAALFEVLQEGEPAVENLSEMPDWLKSMLESEETSTQLEPEASQQPHQQAEPVEAEPVEAELAEAEPVEPSPQQAEPVEAEPVEAELVEAELVETESVEVTGAEAVPDLPSWLEGVEPEAAVEEPWIPPQEEPSVPFPPLDINHASLAELERIPGVGYIAAQAIVAHRELAGPFNSLEELEHVPGLRPGFLEELQDRLVVSVPAAAEAVREPSAEIPPELGQARQALSGGDMDQALEQYTSLMKSRELLPELILDLQDALYKYPLEVPVWQTLGDAYMRNGQLQEALDAYTRAEELLG